MNEANDLDFSLPNIGRGTTGPLPSQSDASATRTPVRARHPRRVLFASAEARYMQEILTPAQGDNDHAKIRLEDDRLAWLDEHRNALRDVCREVLAG